MKMMSKDEIHDILKKSCTTTQIFNVSSSKVECLNGICIIQAFYGCDLERIAATSNALRCMLQSTSRPSSWVFVEGQKSEDDCAFKWLQSFGVQHLFVKMTDKQDGIFMKSPLWNIGAKHTSEPRLCFIDSDVMFCNSGWLSEVQTKFEEGYDVLSLQGWSYYDGDEVKDFDESIGHQFMSNACCRYNCGHFGFTIGMTREIFNRIRGFKCSVVLDDLVYWNQVVGDRIKSLEKWKIDKDKCYGVDAKVGSTEEVACHCDHGPLSSRRYSQLLSIVKDRVDGLDDIIKYDPADPSVLPSFAGNEFGMTIKDSLAKCQQQTSQDLSGDDIYFANARRHFNEVEDNLVVVTSMHSGFQRNVHYLQEFEDVLRQRIRVDFQFVCFSDKVEDSSIQIPFSSNIKRKFEFLEMFREDIVFKENSYILYIPFQKNIYKDIDIVLECNKIAVNKDILFFKYSEKIKNTFKNRLLIGNNIEDFIVFNNIQYDHLSKYIRNFTEN